MLQWGMRVAQGQQGEQVLVVVSTLLEQVHNYAIALEQGKSSRVS